MQTINQFFNLREGSTKWVSTITKSQEFGPIKQRMAQELKAIPLSPSFYELAIRGLTDLLDIELSKILLGAWCKHREIIQYRDKSKYPSGNVYIVPLIEHTITSRHSPTIQPIINDVPLPKIKFDVVLKLKLKGAMLKILDGMITEIQVGSCIGNGSIEYSGFPVLEKGTAPVDFPASFVLKEGIPI